MHRHKEAATSTSPPAAVPAAAANDVPQASFWFLFKAAVIVGSGGLIFGYDIGVIAGTLSQLKKEFHFTSYEEGLVVAILYAGEGLLYNRYVTTYCFELNTLIFEIRASDAF